MIPEASHLNKTFATFARMWSATMIPIIDTSGWRPGFNYTSDEQSEMRKQYVRFPKFTPRYNAFLGVNTVVFFMLMLCTLPVFAFLVGIKRLDVLGASMSALIGLCVGIGMPLACYLTCALLRNVSWNADLTVTDAEFGRRLFAKFCRQCARFGVFTCVVILAGVLWPRAETASAVGPDAPAQHQLPLWQRIAWPLAAVLINLLTLWYYYRRSRLPRS